MVLTRVKCPRCKETFKPRRVRSRGQARRCPKCGCTYMRMSKPVKPMKTKKYFTSSEWARKAAQEEGPL